MKKTHKILLGVAVLALLSLTVAFAVTLSADSARKAINKAHSDTCTAKCCSAEKAACPKMDACEKTQAGACPKVAGNCEKDNCTDGCGCCDGCKGGTCDCEDCKCCDCCKKDTCCCKDGCGCCDGCKGGTCDCEDCKCCDCCSK